MNRSASNFFMHISANQTIILEQLLSDISEDDETRGPIMDLQDQVQQIKRHNPEYFSSNK